MFSQNTSVGSGALSKVKLSEWKQEQGHNTFKILLNVP
jgi:hypothetical protein